MKGEITRLGKGTLIYGVGQILTKLISFLLLPLFTSYLTPSDYGIISLLAVISFLAAPVFGLGLGTATGVVYFEGNSDTQKVKTIWSSFALLLISSLVFLAISFVFSSQISLLIFQTSSSDTSYFIQLTALSTVFNNILIQPFTARLQFEEKSKQFVLLTMVSTIITISLTVFFVVYLQQGVQGFILAGLFGSIIAFLFNFLAVIGWTTWVIDLTIARRLLKLGYPLIPAFFFLFIIQNSGRYMLEQACGLAEVGIYTIGNNFGVIINIAVTAFTSAWFPYFNSYINKQEEAKQIFAQGFTYYIIGCGSLSLLFFSFAKPVVKLMTQQPFHDAYLVVGVISLGYFLVGAFSILVAGAYFSKKVYTLNLSQSLAALMCILLNIWFIPMAGMVGAALSFLTANFGLCLFQYLVNKHYKFLDVKYEWKRIGYFVLISLFIILLTFIPRDFTVVQDFFLGLGFTFIQLTFIYFMLTEKEKQTFFSAIQTLVKKYLAV